MQHKEEYYSYISLNSICIAYIYHVYLAVEWV